MTNATKGHRVTIADVSRAAGCSKGVVSAVVNKAKGNITVSDSTRERVLAAARELGYRPNFASRSLARQSTRTIGIYVPPTNGASLGYSYEGRIVRGVERACREHDYDLLVLNIGGGLSPDQCRERFAEGRMDGLLLLHVPESAPWITPLVDQYSNVFAVNYYGDAPIRHLSFDDRAAGQLATQHLLDQGHRRIAYLGGVQHDFGPGAALRCQGYYDVMADAGIAVNPSWVWDHSSPAFDAKPQKTWSTDEVAAALTHFMGLGDDRPTAVFCQGDQHAIAALNVCARRGISVPDQLALIGVDGSEASKRCFPTLSSIYQPLEGMGQHAANILIGHAEERTETNLIEPEPLWQPRLIVRESTTSLLPE